MNEIKGIFGKDALKEASDTKLYFLDLAEIEVNEKNPFSKMNEDEIKTQLADSIATVGLVNTLKVKKENGKYTLLSGERRYRALCHLYENNRKYSFNGIDITGKAPVVIKQIEEGAKTPEEDEEKNWYEVDEMITANAGRDLSKENKKQTVMMAITHIKQGIEFGILDKKEVGRIADVVSEKTGIAQHFCKDCLAEYNRQEKADELDGNIEEAEEKEQEYNASKELKKAKNKLHKTADWMSNVDWQAMLQECSEDEVQSLKLAFNAIAEQVLILQKTIKDFSK